MARPSAEMAETTPIPRRLVEGVASGGAGGAVHVHVRAPVSIAPRPCARHHFTQREGRARACEYPRTALAAATLARTTLARRARDRDRLRPFSCVFSGMRGEGFVCFGVGNVVSFCMSSSFVARLRSPYATCVKVKMVVRKGLWMMGVVLFCKVCSKWLKSRSIFL